MAAELKEQLINYFESIRQTPHLPAKADKELADGIQRIKQLDITFPHPADTLPETADKVRKMIGGFFNKYPNIMTSPEQIDLQEKNFQLFLQNTGLMKTSNKPSRKR